MSAQSSRLVAFASGKGGVGKTVCTANLALHLAQRHKVLTVDLDLGCGNLNTSLGVRSVSNSINDFLGTKVATLGPLKTATALDSLELISCSYSPLDSTVLSPTQKERLVEQLRSDDADYVFMDLGAGVNDDVLDLFAAADVRVLVTGPESLALHNAFVFVKSLTYRIIARSLEGVGLPKRTRENIIRQLYDSGDQEIGRTIERVRMRDSVAAEAMRQVLSGIQIYLILNKVQESSEERFVTNLQQLTRKYTELELNYLGSVPYDDNVKKSLNDIVPFALEYKLSPANGAFRTIAGGLDQVLSDVLTPRDEPFGLPGQKPIHRLWLFLKDSLSSPLAWISPTPVSRTNPFGEYDSKIRRLSQEVTETRRMHEQEKSDWLKEKDEINRRFEELMSRTGKAPSRSIDSNALEQRDRRISVLEHQLREALGTVESLREQVGKLEDENEIMRSREPEGPEPLMFPAAESDRASDAESQALAVSESEYLSVSPAPTTIGELILARLLEYSWYRITIVQMEEGGIEVARYAGEIAGVISAAQWATSSVSSSFKENQFCGLKIIHDDSREAIEGARILGQSFEAAGIDYAMQRAPFPTEFERIRLVVGRSSEGTQRTLDSLLATTVRST